MMSSGMSGGSSGGGLSGMRGGRVELARPRDMRGSLSKLFGYLGPHRKALIAALLLAIGSTAASIFGPYILGQAVTELGQGAALQLSGRGAIDFGRIGQILLTALILYALSAAFYYLHAWIMASVATDVAYRLRREISEKNHRLPLRYFDGVTRGEVLSRITNDVDTINQTLSQSMSQIVIALVTVVGVLIMMLTINWIMTLLALITVPLSMVVSIFVLRRSHPALRQQQATLGLVNGQVEEIYGGHVVVQAFNQEAPSMRRFEAANDRLYTANWKSQALTGVLSPLMTFIGNLGYVMIAVAGVWLAILRTITVGDILAFIQYVRSFTQPITQLASSSGVLQQAAVAAERVFDFLAEAEEVAEASIPVRLEKAQGRVDFDHVRFGYAPERTVLDDFSARVEPGQKVAIVGPTGAGKTTVVKLLMRFYDVDAGAILVDGYDIRDLARSDLRRSFGMVLQDSWVYSGTIMENIRYGRLEASDEDVLAAARAAHVDHFVHTLPDGYQMVLNEESSNVSQGQLQLLTIARAVLADPRILILDEATSSVDTRTELLIQAAMDGLMAGRTSFVIAHRLSTIRDADLILVMRDGSIIEQGKHEELLDRDGFYASLYRSQFAQIDAS